MVLKMKSMHGVPARTRG